MSKRTPGPWTPTYATATPSQKRRLTREKNARLIAAAPDLLFSLKALTLFLKDRTETSHLLNVAMEQARAAIAKAEGAS